MARAMAKEQPETPSTASAVFGRAGPPRVAMPNRGTAIGLCWSGAEGAGNLIVAAKVECGPERARLARLWRPFADAPGRRDIRERLAPWLAEELRWAEGRLVLGVDFALSLGETHLRQLGLLRQGLKGPGALGQALAQRFLTEAGDFSEGAARFRAELGKDRPRVTDHYRAEPYPPSSARMHRRTFFGLVALARLEAAFPPWDPPRPGVPTVVEVRPHHVARVLCGCGPHRDDRDGTSRSSTRAAVLRTLRAAARLEFEMELAAPIVQDEAGDHLDAVLSATGAAAAWAQGFHGVPANVPRSEGWIYSVDEEPWRER
jgi:hypothetical protein